MDAPGETSRVNGENVTKDILKDLIKYRASPNSHLPDFPLKVRMRKISEKIKIEMDVKDPFKPEDLLTNLQALEGVIHALYLHAETEEQHVLYTVCLFTYVAELCKNVQVESHDLIADKVIYDLKSTEKGLFALSLFQKMYDREKTKNDSQESDVINDSNRGRTMVREKAVNIKQKINFLSLIFL